MRKMKLIILIAISLLYLSCGEEVDTLLTLPSSPFTNEAPDLDGDGIGSDIDFDDTLPHIGVVVVHKGSITTIYGPEFDWDSDTGSMVPGKSLNDMSNKQSITPGLLNAVVGAKKNLKWKDDPDFRPLPLAGK